MTTYHKFNSLNIDTTSLGLNCGDNDNLYFCTPKDAQIIGSAGVDGIHFCFVRGFGEMIFAVSPMNTLRDYVHPLAESFMDFLRLLLTCGNTASLEQAHSWDNAQFDAFLQENPPTTEQRNILNTLADKLKISPMEQPFFHIKNLQAAFDYSRIPYTHDYEECVTAEPKLPEWKVYYDGNFWGHHGKDRSGTEIITQKQFLWGERSWHIPAVYSTSKGLVVDFCMRVPAEQIQTFLEKWNLSPEQDGSDFTQEQQLQAEAENPLAVDFTAVVTLNGHALQQSHGCGGSWNPCFPELNGLEMQAVLKHYNLDPTFGWAIHRVAFPWKTKRKPQITTLSIMLEQRPTAIHGIRFHVSSPDDSITFAHPLTKEEYTLTVQEYENQELPSTAFGNQDYEYPLHYTAMSYTISPKLPDEKLTVSDCAGGDRPRQKEVDSLAPQVVSDCCVGIIGGADGPTAITVGEADSQGKLCAACSALHFAPVEDIEWRIVFHEKTCTDISIQMIP